MSSSIIFDGFKFQVAQVCRKMCYDCQYSEDSSSCFVNRKTTDHWQYDLCLLYCQCKCRDSTDYRDLTPIPPAPMGLPLPITPMVSDYTRQHLDLGSVSGFSLNSNSGEGVFCVHVFKSMDGQVHWNKNHKEETPNISQTLLKSKDNNLFQYTATI